MLLKSLIYYELDGRRYHGRHIRDNIWAYEYPYNGYNHRNHPRPYINGRWLEAAVELMVRKLLSDDAVLGNELDRSEGAITQSITNLHNELRSLERRENANTNAEAQLLLDRNRYGEISDGQGRLGIGGYASTRRLCFLPTMPPHRFERSNYKNAALTAARTGD